MKRVVSLLFYILVTFSLCFWSVAADLPRARYLPVQSYGMGSAFLPMAEDNVSALFYQPSALARRKKNTIDALNIQLEGGTGYFTENVFHAPTVSSLDSKFKGSTLGYYPYIGNQIAFGFGLAGFSFGALYSQKGSATIQGAEFLYDVKFQLIPAIGYGILLGDGAIRLGYTLQWVHQESASRRVLYTDSVSVLDDLDKGSALSHNFGFTFTLPQRFLPALDIVMRNINKAEYAPFALPVFSGASNTDHVPDSDPMSMDASLSIHPKIYQNSKASFVLQYTDVTNRSATPFLRRVSLGTQLELGSILRLRAGLSEGYPSLGLGLERKYGQFDVSWYTVERGDSIRTSRDIRVAGQFKVNFDLFR